MSRSSKAFLAVVTVSLLGFATPTVFGLDMPNPKPKKDKKKKDDAASGDSTTKTDSTAPAKSDSTAAPAAKDDAPAKDDTAAKTADAPPPAAAPAAPQTMEIKVAKSFWETSGAKDMKVGDWIEGEMPMVPGSTSRQEVIEVGDHYTVTLNSSTMMGQKQQSKMKMIYSEPDPDPKAVEKQKQDLKMETKEFADKMTIKGKELTCMRYETYQDGKLVAKSWVSKDVPLGGALKSEMADGKVASIITDFGRGK